MPTLFDDLPNEILELIISVLSQSRLEEFVAILRVCRKWHDIILPLVWQDVVLTKSNILSFSTTVLKYPNLASRPRSLTLDIKLSYDEYSLTYKVAEYLESLIKVLPTMHHLETFSLQHHVDQSSPYPSSAMTNDLIMGLVSSLPPSVRNLEVDSAVMYFTQHTGSQCLCSTLSHILPHLHSLRLAYPRVCPKLLDVPSPTLQYLVINGIMQNFRPGIRGCDVAGEQARLSWDALQEQRITISIATIKNFLRAVQERILGQSTSSAAVPSSTTASSIFPALKSFVVLEPYHFLPSDSADFFLTNVHSITPKDGEPTSSARIICQCFPTWMDNLYQYFILRHCVYSPPKPKSKRFAFDTLNTSTSLLEDDHHYHTDTCSHHDVGGSFTELRTMLESSAGWSTSAHKARAPKYLVHTTPFHAHMTQLNIETEVNDSFERWQLQQRQQAHLHQHDTHSHQYRYRQTAQIHNRLAWYNTREKGLHQPIYTTFRCLDGFCPSEADFLYRDSSESCRCRKCQRSRQWKRHVNNTIRDTSLTSIVNAINNDGTLVINGPQYQQGDNMDDSECCPTPIEHYLDNRIWRTEGDLQQTLLCGREFYHGDDRAGHDEIGMKMPASLVPADFELRINRHVGGVIL